MGAWPEIDLAEVEVLLCDADGNLFPSEEPAFEASCGVLNRYLAELGIARRFEPEELRLAMTGMAFRATASELAAAAGIEAGDGLEPWVEEERRRVTAHLGATLQPDPDVIGPLEELAGDYAMAAVSSSASSRLSACFEATGLAELFPPEARFSAEDSLPSPTSKPDPAIYVHAGEQLGIGPGAGLAIEDSVPGARSAVAAGFATIGNMLFVPDRERPRRDEELRRAGAVAVISSWHELRDLLRGGARAAAPGSARGERAPC